MSNYCKFCGYRFKDKDEQICPECLTAREEDISCGVYGEDEHSHARYDDRYAPPVFAKNDTFRDGTADFLREEKRYEDHTAASKYERRNGGDIGMEIDDRRPKPNSYQRPPYNGNNYNMGYNAPRNTTQQNKGCNKGCAVLIFLIAAVVVAFSQSEEIIRFLDEKLSKVTETSTSTDDRAALSKNATPFNEETDVDKMNVYLVSTSVMDNISSDDGSLDMLSRQALYLVEDGEYVRADRADARKLKVFEFDIEFQDKNGNCIPREDLEIELVQFVAFDEDGNALSSCEGVIADKLVMEFNDVTSMRPTLYADDTSTDQQLMISGRLNGEEVFYTIDMAL
ncbi:hypothetical protein [Ruminococcus sp.]|uniref:hypothetical protein n=1 Tax=Ruminococcus sp. TaxID=41978 RepID=UPI0025E68C8D|nr:hypothetical protein [Ruminococcus sp.]MBQ8967952.1 hypothetical protein [Ruminococcus sp.]